MKKFTATAFQREFNQATTDRHKKLHVISVGAHFFKGSDYLHDIMLDMVAGNWLEEKDCNLVA